MIYRFPNAVLALCLMGLITFTGLSQAPQADTWMRVQSDDGEFSIEVPSENSFFYDENGFSITANHRDHTLKKMEMLNAYTNDSLISFERYDGNKEALQRMVELDLGRKDISESIQIEKSGLNLRQVERKLNTYTSITWYFYSKTHIYVLTAASRWSETQAMRRFLDSLEIRPGGKVAPGIRLLSGLPKVGIEVDKATIPAPGAPQTPGQSVAILQSTEKTLPSVIVSRPLVSFTESARSSRVNGKIMMRITLAKNGFIPKLAVVTQLPDGLLRQSVFAALRVKFLPKLVDGVPADSVKGIEYSFSIY